MLSAPAVQTHVRKAHAMKRHTVVACPAADCLGAADEQRPGAVDNACIADPGPRQTA